MIFMNNITPTQKSITVKNRTKECENIFNFLTGFIESIDIPKNIYDDLRLIVEETFINIVNYAYEDNECHEITIKIYYEDNAINIEFRDSGIAFNPISDSDPFIENDDHSKGGMGLQIVKSLSDTLRYERINQCNVFTVTKHYTKLQ